MPGALVQVEPSGLPRVLPMRMQRKAAPFNSPDWVFEAKIDGFRALAYVQDGRCELVSRNGNAFNGAAFRSLADRIGGALKARSAILDGELCCLGSDGRSLFYDLMFRRGTPFFHAFDQLYIDGIDVRSEPLLRRKARLRRVVPVSHSPVLYVSHIRGKGVELFREVCNLDMEGIVGKLAVSAYDTSGNRSRDGVKIKNPDYTQIQGRYELFERRGRAGGSPGELL